VHHNKLLRPDLPVHNKERLHSRLDNQGLLVHSKEQVLNRQVNPGQPGRNKLAHPSKPANRGLLGHHKLHNKQDNLDRLDPSKQVNPGLPVPSRPVLLNKPLKLDRQDLSKLGLHSKPVTLDPRVHSSLANQDRQGPSKQLSPGRQGLNLHRPVSPDLQVQEVHLNKQANRGRRVLNRQDNPDRRHHRKLARLGQPGRNKQDSHGQLDLSNPASLVQLALSRLVNRDPRLLDKLLRRSRQPPRLILW
jgi:hypothetical protein